MSCRIEHAALVPNQQLGGQKWDFPQKQCKYLKTKDLRITIIIMLQNEEKGTEPEVPVLQHERVSMYAIRVPKTEKKEYRPEKNILRNIN